MSLPEQWATFEPLHNLTTSPILRGSIQLEREQEKVTVTGVRLDVGPTALQTISFPYDSSKINPVLLEDNTIEFVTTTIIENDEESEEPSIVDRMDPGESQKELAAGLFGVSISWLLQYKGCSVAVYPRVEDSQRVRVDATGPWLTECVFEVFNAKQQLIAQRSFLLRDEQNFFWD